MDMVKLQELGEMTNALDYYYYQTYQMLLTVLELMKRSGEEDIGLSTITNLEKILKDGDARQGLFKVDGKAFPKIDDSVTKDKGPSKGLPRVLRGQPRVTPTSYKCTSSICRIVKNISIDISGNMSNMSSHRNP
ncbi:hypothetical protein J4Q44_G00174110 [Coregonus suidteri]|uniref:Uncharacterized protein n=1 Tax=Coregonus suidteri TaxID=861788 RepID=A0AAN8LG61_9TELE